MGRRILAVDDHIYTCHQLAMLLAQDGHQLETLATGRAAQEALPRGGFHLLITDWKLPDLDGLELLATIRGQRLPIGVIVLTAHGDPAVALEAMKAGADDFVAKPFDPDRFRMIVRRVLERRTLMDELEHLRHQLKTKYGFRDLVSKSPRMRRVFDLIEQVGPLGSTVLIHGETGTGKELVARAIHDVSQRRHGPLVAVNCAALQDSLLESELFGHEKGAFTGADTQRKGRFELADNGTLLLDEIGDISPMMQAKLLRVLQTGRFERVGGNETIQVDVRIIAATHKRLEDEVRAGRFRGDLFYRLNVVGIDVPPLRERTEDIPLLAAHFLEKLRTRSTPPVTEIHHEAMQALLDHTWPGNVRELENAIKAAVAMADGTTIHRDTLPTTIAPDGHRRVAESPPILDLDRPLPDLCADLVGQVEREYLSMLLARYRGNIARCARHSGLSRRSVAQKLDKYGLDRDEFRF